ncbi:MAG: Flp family type IVb pilin [Myxococcales bacterium]
MNTLMNRFRAIARKSRLANDERGLSTVEYVIILVLIAAAAVGTWSKFGGTIMAKINSAEKEVNDNVVITSDGQGGPAKSGD